jgi:hypothetical protein
VDLAGNPLNIGTVLGGSRTLELSPKARGRHLYVCGGTGVGKSKLLEHCIRQDILNWKDSHCGLLLLDPEGLVYKNTMAWVAKHNLKRPIVPIELRRDDWVISYNLLRRRKLPDPAVVVGNFVNALAHVWGEAGTDHTPLFARWASVLLLTLYQNGCTVSDMMQLLSREDVKRAMISRLSDDAALHSWQRAAGDRKEFEREVGSTLNRFQRLLGPLVMKATFGQPDVSLDLLSAMNEGKIVLVDLSTEGGLIDDEHADTYATLLLADLWAAARERGNAEDQGIKPFYVYIDECQNFITPTIAKNLDRARKYGLHLTLANQFPTQFLNEGPSGKAMYDSIMANAKTKVVFKLEHSDDAKAMAQWLFINTFDTDEIKHVLHSTKVMGYRQEVRESRTTGTSKTDTSGTGHGGGKFQGQSSGEGSTESTSFNEDDDAMARAEAWNFSIANASGESESWSENDSTAKTASQSVTRTVVDRPVMGTEVSSVQFRSIDEQVFRATQKLFDQRDRHFAVRCYDGPKAPQFVKTPTVVPGTARKERVEELRGRLLRNLPYALSMEEATKRLDERKKKLLTEFIDVEVVDEPARTGRRIK